MKIKLPTINSKAMIETLIIVTSAVIRCGAMAGRFVKKIGREAGKQMSRLLIGGINRAFSHQKTQPDKKGLAARAVRLFCPDNMAYLGEQFSLLPAIPATVIGGIVGMGQGIVEAVTDDDDVMPWVKFNKEKESVEVEGGFKYSSGPAPGYEPPSY